MVDGVGSGGAGMQYYRIDPATGRRQSLLRDIYGDSCSVWDPIRARLWTAGGFATTLVVALDLLADPPVEMGNIKCLASGADWYQCMRGAGDIDSHNRGGLFCDPLDGNLVLAHGAFGLVRVEVHTGNRDLISL